MTYQTHPQAVRTFQHRAARTIRHRGAPTPRLRLSEWADRFRVLSPESAAEPAQWRTDKVPYLREIMDAVGDPDIPFMVVMKSAQVGYTEGVVNNAVGYFIDQDPCPMMVVQPSDGDAEKWSKMKLATMLRDTPRLRGRVAEAKSRSTENTILLKMFAGGVLNIVGATSPKGLAAMPARVALLDEVDRYPPSAGTEGDPIKLVERRLTTFWNRKQILGSTPTWKGLSRIEKAFLQSDQRYWEVPCPHCGAYQVLRFGGRDASYGLKWEDGKPETVAYLCAECGVLIEEQDKEDMVRAGRWVATHPAGRWPGWHVNALMSLFDGARWPLIVAEFLEAKDDPFLLQTFVNTVLGETYEDRAGTKIDARSLEARREQWEGFEVPNGVAVLTAFVDVQDDWIELEVDGWGAGEENWTIGHWRLPGDPDQKTVWESLEAFRTRGWRHESGRELRIQVLMIDSRHKTKAVYDYVRPRQGQNVFATRGIDERGRAALSRPTRANRDKVKVFSVGTITMKDVLFARLRIQRPGPGYIHFGPETESGLDTEYFAQFEAEKPVVEKVRGRPVRKYAQIRKRNEAIDLKVGNLAALHVLGQAFREKLGKLAAQLAVPSAAKPTVGEGDEPAAPVKRKRSNWVNRWRT